MISLHSFPTFCKAGFLLTVAICSSAPGQGIKPDITVALDGSGAFKSVQAAIDSIPPGNTERRIVFIRNGTYHEKLRLENSFVTLLGEDRTQTRIVWENPAAGAPPGGGLNFRDQAGLHLVDASDIVIDNLTIDNPAKTNPRPFVIISSGKGTRVVIQNAEITSLGGDTLSLWTRGFYYHRNLHVSGSYHFLGPRGTCYISDSLLECVRPVTNALFNEGMEDERQKFVLQRCRVIAKEPIGLGSNFRDAAWYFIDCEFPDTLKPDGHIWIAQSNPKQPKPVSEMFKWATDRIYFSGSKGPDHPWLKDNVAKSPAKTAAVIDAAWTFSGEWDPESKAPPAIAGVTRADELIGVAFAEPVTVKGLPVLTLADGRIAAYQSGSGSETLVFRASGTAAPKTIALRGGAILASRASAQLRLVADSTPLSK